jgi:hypothetical protein
MEWFIVLVMVVVSIAVFYIIKRSRSTVTYEIDEVVQIDKGVVTIKGKSHEEFDISIKDENGDFKYKVKDGNIISVELPQSNKFMTLS